MIWALFTQPVVHWCDPLTKQVRNTLQRTFFNYDFILQLQYVVDGELKS